MHSTTRALTISFLAVFLCAQGANAAFLIPSSWTRGDSYSTYQGWDVFASPAGPNPPNSPASGAIVDAAPFNPNGLGNAFDTSGQSFVTSGGNIYSFSAPTHIAVSVPEYALGDGYVTTILFQTRTQGTEPIYSGPDGYRLTYSDASGSHTIFPASAQELSREALGGFGGDLVDNATVFLMPGSPDMFTINFDASDVSMSLDRIAVDTITTRAAVASPLLAGMNPTIGYVTVAVPEPAALGALTGLGLLMGLRPRRRVINRA